MPIHHLAVAVKDVHAAHDFYTKGMGFTLAKVVKNLSPAGGWTKHLFYDIGDGSLFAIWDMRGMKDVLPDDSWRGGLSTGAGLPVWVNHIAFTCDGAGDMEVRKQRWLAYGRTVIEVDHEFVRSIYTNDPDGTFVEWTYNVRALTEDDRIEAERLLLDDSPSDHPGEAAIFHSPPVAV